MSRRPQGHLAAPFALPLALGACYVDARVGAREASSPTVVIEAESYTDQQGAFALSGDGTYVTSPAGGGWLAYEVEVPVAGRYRVELGATSTGESRAWIQDYYDNPYDRTYNVTGWMPLPTAEADSALATKDGSPFNSGRHRIRLHVEGEPARIDQFRLTLMKEHQVTPRFLEQAMDGDEWVLIWSDEFEGDGLPDPAKWTHDIGDWGWGNHELQYYTERRLENARREDGHLIIEAHKDDTGHAWTSARLTTRGKVGFTYGKIEIRAKVPAKKGTWAAGWTLGDAYRDELSWPTCGEIDILESVGFETDDATGDGMAHASAHTPAYYFKIGNQISAETPVRGISTEFHTYAVEWSPSAIKAFVDGRHYFSYDKTNGEDEWPFHRPQNIILNLAMGGGWGGELDPEMTSQQYVIDYVRVHEKR